MTPPAHPLQMQCHEQTESQKSWDMLITFFFLAYVSGSAATCIYKEVLQQKPYDIAPWLSRIAVCRRLQRLGPCQCKKAGITQSQMASPILSNAYTLVERSICWLQSNLHWLVSCLRHCPYSQACKQGTDRSEASLTKAPT